MDMDNWWSLLREHSARRRLTRPPPDLEAQWRALFDAANAYRTPPRVPQTTPNVPRD